MKILENYPYVLTDPLFVGLMMEYFEKNLYLPLVVTNLLILLL